MLIHQHKFILSLSAIVIMLAIIIMLIIYPALRDILAINTTIAQEKEILEQKLALGLNIKTTESILTSIEETQPLLDSVFIRQGKELEFITQIEQAAMMHSIQLELKPDFAGKAVTADVTEATIAINAIGTYPDLQKFLKAIEQLPYYYSTEALVISQSKSASTSEMQFLGKAYILK